MARYIEKVHMSGGTNHEHIAEVQWRDGTSTGKDSRAEMVRWIDAGNSAKVADGIGSVDVKTVNATPKYIRTQKDGRWTDNLLSLPRY